MYKSTEIYTTLSNIKHHLKRISFHDFKTERESITL